ncbi:MAG: prolyl oligopeptidase family serine peptidase, partial [Gammaproteobacteria bacterium]|nr:prolyl oligopeptidase family serine peptidase [Gammaproteobacteria bacterium]
WPAARETYRVRSPLYAAGRIRCPVIFFQGLKDKVVPPDQTQRMVQALRANQVPVECLEFPEEGHGFRRRETLQRTLEAELAFYGRVFGFTPAAGA